MFEYDDLIRGWSVKLVQSVSELPNLKGAKKIYLDLETTSLDSEKASTNPHMDCYVLGIAITVDNCPYAYYIPLQHEHDKGRYCNLPEKPVFKWLSDILENGDEWINHNLKYDAHVLKNSAGIDVSKMRIKLCDTQVRIKIIHSDRLNYELRRVMSDFLFIDIKPFEEELKLALGRGNKDYGLVPIPQMAKYAGVDALSVRELNNYCEDNLAAECKRVWDLESELTPVLFNIEQNGMKVDTWKVYEDLNIFPTQLAVYKEKIAAIVNDRKFKPHVSSHVERLLCGHYGLPIVELTKEGKPSFGKGAFEVYKSYPGAPIDVLQILLDYRELWKLYTSFTTPYAKYGSIIHCDYNQIVRTGRMSCRTPNMQQLSKRAKEYIIPSDKGRVIVDIDFSQIEFRLITHYINSQKCIADYKNNPEQDYHQWVADMCVIDRDPAKNINFAIGYGAGMKKVLTMLSAIPEIVGELRTEEERMARAKSVYFAYHKALPTLRTTRYQASQAALKRGYVRTIMNRHRDIPAKLHFIAFNSVIQGSAADLMKAAALRLASYLSNYPEIKLIGLVHDSFVLDMAEEDLQLLPEMKEVINELPEGVTLKVPIRSGVKISKENWALCM